MSESDAAVPRVYLAGPDIYHSRALEIAANKKTICERYGLAGVSPLDIGGGRRHSGTSDDALTHYRATLELIAAAMPCWPI